ncbi:MAG: M28 family peptidase [Balneolaceae bacterium]|nr:MAG: M28 family peptidase [Balneolaceae bacterium]
MNTSTRFLLAGAFAATLLLTGCGNGQDTRMVTDPEISVDDLRKHVYYLASEELKGREAGSPQEAVAANYIADHFEAFGLIPAGENEYLQEFSFTRGVRQQPGRVYLESTGVRINAEEGIVRAWGISGSGRATGRLVFAGYGIQDTEGGFDEYQAVDVTGKVVMIMRGDPESDEGADDRDIIRERVRLAEDNGAAAILMTVPSHYEGTQPLLPLRYDRLAASATIPVLQLTRETARILMQYAAFDLDYMESEIIRSGEPVSVETDMPVRVVVDLATERRIARNVIGLVEGTGDPERYIVVGAHYDHLGFGEHASLYNGTEPRIHPGSDDNASGTAGLLELAHYFAENSPHYSLLFIAFSAEEMGLLGSEYFMGNPVVPIDDILAMINMDMIGRLTDGQLAIFGTGSSDIWNELIGGIHIEGIEVRMSASGTGNSDHTSFYLREIPVLHYFTGTHAQYHRPDDLPDLINYEGLASVVNHVAQVIDGINRYEPGDIIFTGTARAPVMGMPGAVTLGLVPDYSYEGDGFRISGVAPGRPGDLAGIRAGDILIAFNNARIADIYDYMRLMREFHPGDKVAVTVMRENEEILLTVVFEP